ncbi:Cyanovirin-N [Aspergillus floccosus]
MNATEGLHLEFSGPDTYLAGFCMDPSSRNWRQSRLRLDSCLGDSRGSFQWGGHDFTEDAINIRFNPEEGGSHVPVLRAELRDDAGSYHEKDVNLAERINNYNGYLEFH